MTYRMNPKSAAQAGEGTPLIRVLVVDDHPLVRAGIVAALSNLPDMVVVGQVGDGSQAIAAVAELAPDVVLMDLRMPILNGVEATVRIVKNGGQVPRVLVLTTIDTDAAIVHAVKAGAAGYLLKDIPAEELIDAVRAVAAGRYVLESAMAARVARVTQHAAERLTAREV
ncbi:MAG: response regulator transcription factor, partial [Promicromonosporaceae bacterium]|nr:response regulator transcription factor [Promicromonosporaceae bacterium]